LQVPQETLTSAHVLTRSLYYRCACGNFDQPVATVVGGDTGADFADVFEVRGVSGVPGVSYWIRFAIQARVRFRVHGRGGQDGRRSVELEPSRLAFRIDGGRVRVAWDVQLAARESVSLWITVHRLETRAGLPSRQRAGCRRASSLYSGVAWRVCADHQRQRAVRSTDRRVCARSATR